MNNTLLESSTKWIEADPESSKRTLQRDKLIDRFATVLMSLAALLLVLVLLSVIGILLYRGLSTISWKFLTSAGTFTEIGGGIGPQIFVSVYILFLSLLFTTPVGVGAAI